MVEFVRVCPDCDYVCEGFWCPGCGRIQGPDVMVKVGEEPIIVKDIIEVSGKKEPCFRIGTQKIRPYFKDQPLELFNVKTTVERRKVTFEELE